MKITKKQLKQMISEELRYVDHDLIQEERKGKDKKWWANAVWGLIEEETNFASGAEGDELDQQKESIIMALKHVIIELEEGA